MSEAGTATEAHGKGFTRIRSVVLGILTVEVLALIASGVWLYFSYRPSSAQAWNNANGTFADEQVVRVVHRLVAYATVPTGIAVAVLLAVGRRPSFGPIQSVFNGLAMTSLAVAAIGTGFRLAWDQLALWAVTVGSTMDGYEPMWSGQVRFVLIDGFEVSTSTILRWLIAHVVLAALLMLVAATSWRRLLWRRS